MDKRKELKEQYKARKIIGGVYRIYNKENGRFFLQSTADINAARNRYAGFFGHNGCSLPPIQEDWKLYGPSAFAFEELDVLEKGSDQSDKDYKADIQALFDMWSEKLPGDMRY